jgi:hypothetical protein
MDNDEDQPWFAFLSPTVRFNLNPSVPERVDDKIEPVRVTTRPFPPTKPGPAVICRPLEPELPNAISMPSSGAEAHRLNDSIPNPVVQSRSVPVHVTNGS